LERFKCSRDEFIAGLKNEGVEAAVHYPRPLNQQPPFAADNLRLPNCEWLSERIMSLPVHPMLSASDLEQVAGAVIKVATQMRR
jgi:UDP-2-acetamido-2-deoxy-ribo-hexuluronate aminotransferase